VAEQLLRIDPRKDLVRQQSSHFKATVEEERVAKRHKKLCELEARDEAIAKMEAMFAIKVQAWRCQECKVIMDSTKAKVICEQRAHHFVTVTVEKTRWQCKGCSFSVHVLDKQLPEHCCSRCRGWDWKQVSLYRGATTTSMPKDDFLARGEEMKFVNSVPGLQPKGSWKNEGKDDYDNLMADNSFA